MGVLLKLRVLIWILVITLWGMLVYQFLDEEDAERTRVQYIGNPYKGMPLPNPGSGEQAAPYDRTSLLTKIPAIPNQAPTPSRRLRWPMRPEGDIKSAVTIPPGFIKRVTRHFNVYSEGSPAGDEFVALLENLHGNLMLDLASFSPWAQDEKASIFLFKNQDTYRRVTGRPSWSGGASSVPRRLVYLFESGELPGILAHELCHIYYDGFFLEGKTNPLWLSEGMATLVQVQRGLAAPAWLRENLELLEKGDGYSLSELMSVNNTKDASDAKIRLWYAQSYSIVRFLIRSQYKSSFYNFSLHLREGRPVTEALYRAYGMPYNRLKALEYAWRYEISANGISKLTSEASSAR